jgi:anti-sigma regulatory factor (Ser/Thr protein kinase)
MHPTNGGIGTVRGGPSMDGALFGIPEFDSGAGPAIHGGGTDSSFGHTWWPKRSHLDLGAFPGAVPCARIHARFVVGEWGLPKLAEVLELVVSELVTNGVQAAARIHESWGMGKQRAPGTPSVKLWLGTDYRQVLVQVWDGHHELPVRQDAGPEAEGGRGLLLVETLSTAWGSYRPAGCSGKVVWAVIA